MDRDAGCPSVLQIGRRDRFRVEPDDGAQDGVERFRIASPMHDAVKLLGKRVRKLERRSAIYANRLVHLHDGNPVAANPAHDGFWKFMGMVTPSVAHPERMTFPAGVANRNTQVFPAHLVTASALVADGLDRRTPGGDEESGLAIFKRFALVQACIAAFPENAVLPAVQKCLHFRDIGNPAAVHWT
jgi:hypothetical protein